MICRVDDGEIVRRVSTAATGGFQSGPLPSGDYTVIAKQPNSAAPPRIGLQSAPIYLYPGVPSPRVELNADPAKGQIAVTLAEPLPRLEVKDKYVIDTRLFFRVQPLAIRSLRWTAKSAMPESWPLFVESPEAGLDAEAQKNRAFREPRSYAVLSNDAVTSGQPIHFLDSTDRLIAGPYRITAIAAADIKPFEQSDEVPNPFSGTHVSDNRPLLWMSSNWIFGSYMGRLWLSKLQQQPGTVAQAIMGGFGSNSSSVSSPFWESTDIELAPEQLNRVRIEIPSDVISRIQKLADTVTDPGEFSTAVRKERPFLREAKVTLVGTEAMKAAGQDADELTQ